MDSEKGSPRQSVDAEQRKKWATAMTCWTCGRKGHIARFCRSRGVEQQSGNSSPSVVKANHALEGQRLKAKESPVIVPIPVCVMWK